MIEYREVFSDDIEVLARSLRVPDYVEACAAHGTPSKALTESINVSDEVCTVLEDGAPIAFAGYAIHAVGPLVAMPWLLGSERVYKHPVTLIRRGRKLIEELEPHSTFMLQYVWRFNHESSKYLEALGFQVYPSLSTERAGQPFIAYGRAN